MRKFKGFFLIIYMGLMLLMFATFRASIAVWSSFFISAFVLLAITIYHLYYEKHYSPFISSYIVFTFMFFLAAPISQINSFFGIGDPKYQTLFPYRENLVIYANALISGFNAVFIIAYIQFKKRLVINKVSLNTKNSKILPLTIFVILLISILIFFNNYAFVIGKIDNINGEALSKASILIIKKIFFMIPLAGVILCYQYFKKKQKNKSNYINIIFFLSIFLILLFWFKNPFTEKRNALGPIYISLIFLMAPRILNNNIKIISFLFFSLIILFPLTSIITHSNATLFEMYRDPTILINQIKGGAITEVFNTLHYDAFSNITATISYVNKYGFSYGYQLLGGILFFIPRSIWVSKSFSTGQVVGEYLMNEYGTNISNLSNPLISESFINFGIIAVFLTAIVLAYIIVKMIKWIYSDDYLKKIMSFYFAIHLIFLLRGDFTNGFSYYIGPLIAVVVFPKFIEYIIKELIFIKKNVGTKNK